ncbi:hypothetical protein [Archangium lansingense]|uniref:ABC transmembrane type-1 domain-containing protein n=1 Tax=Archangium lansingense TaxID=2995310 RepID=A0ABT4AQJ0_9BACT|nr:hypothetical protein [Archangium lansinium]MCY1083434.1 hypothetical protein [Archangium lansinium]
MSQPRHGSLPASGPSREDRPRSFWRDGQAAFSLVFRSPLALFILGGLTFVTAHFTLQKTGLQGLAYLHSSRAQFWNMLVSLTPTIWIISIFLLYGDLERNRSAWPRTRSGWMALMLCLAPLLLLLALPLLAQLLTLREDSLVAALLLPLDPNFFSKWLSMSILGLLTPALLFSALVGIHLQLLGRLPKYQYLGEPLGSESLDEEVLWYQRQQSQLRRFLNLAAAHLGISILSVGAFRNLINMAIAFSAEPLPTAPIMSYGLYYTALIASLYMPAHNTLKGVGQALADRLVWQSLGAHPTWKQRLEEQQAVRNQLGLQGSALQEFQQGLAVFAPFIASISSLALGTGG